MRRSFDRFPLLLVSIAGCLSQPQRDAIDSLRDEESRAPREALGERRLRLSEEAALSLGGQGNLTH